MVKLHNQLRVQYLLLSTSSNQINFSFFLAASLCVWRVSVWSDGHIYWPSLCALSHCHFWGSHYSHGKQFSLLTTHNLFPVSLCQLGPLRVNPSNKHSSLFLHTHTHIISFQVHGLVTFYKLLTTWVMASSREEVFSTFCPCYFFVSFSFFPITRRQISPSLFLVGIDRPTKFSIFEIFY